ncbi:universal stress protein [Candidatus Bathyarchaeota archaeon]|mgnify:CR=1 FL=1|jgi:nucleotide-binding universal stress UspA family protein|nr:universal stress protein [Candidatus Bathyarchaeota archaeon]MBT4321143.1 universal stress protein [Candidatus Bathyarchaeota archaeon]MBT4424560.1 universal stress protein [Candidatus Bathyarchaeota archaeon]MBT5641699.1 universal stress protein [Candidatus Bathyarchaeota archaeon]MBT6605739.1 universal stress protein [Candidatus Bathyarchaeota archaeon]
MYKTILVATDGSELAQHAVEFAAISAEKWGANLLVLTVVPPPTAMYAGMGGYDNAFTAEHEKALMSYHVGVLEDAKKSLKEKYPKLTVSTQLKKGYVAKKILKASEETEVDLIVIGSRGLGGLTGWFLGSVTNHVVNHCTKPILVVK